MLDSNNDPELRFEFRKPVIGNPYYLHKLSLTFVSNILLPAFKSNKRGPNDKPAGQHRADHHSAQLAARLIAVLAYLSELFRSR